MFNNFIVEYNIGRQHGMGVMFFLTLSAIQPIFEDLSHPTYFDQLSPGLIFTTIMITVRIFYQLCKFNGSFNYINGLKSGAFQGSRAGVAMVSMMSLFGGLSSKQSTDHLNDNQVNEDQDMSLSTSLAKL